LIVRECAGDERHWIQPTKRRAFDGTVKKVEAVYVKDGLHAMTSFPTVAPGKDAGAASEEAAPRSAVETDRRDVPSK